MRCFKIALMSLSMVVANAALSAEAARGFEDAAVVLRYSTNIALGQDDSRRLFEKAIEILRTSNFNSAKPLWEWDEAKINLEYGRAVSGKHLLVTFDEAKQIKTSGGYVSVRELIVGLNGSQYASSVHTIDDDGQVIGHAKYLGQLCIELLELVKDIAARSPNNVGEPPR